MSTERSNERYAELDTWPLSKSLQELVSVNHRAVAAVEAALDPLTRAAEGIERCLSRGGRLVYIGAGTSGRLALQDAAELLPTFGFEGSEVLLAGGSFATTRAREGAEDDEAAARQAVTALRLGPDDACLGLAASGRTPYTVAGLEQAAASGAFTVGIAHNPETPLLKVADIGIFLNTGPEVLAGSTRLLAGTAQKIVLNALSTAVLIRLGGAYGNLMVGMKASNAKLRRRAVDIVSSATGASEPEARKALQASGGSMREAIVSLARGVSVERARDLLSANRNLVREAIADKRGEHDAF